MPERAIEVHGLRELRRELKRAGEQFPKEMREANRAAAELVVPEARRRAPKGPHEGKPAVRPITASIRAGGTQRVGYVVIGGARSPHAPVYEFGGTIPRRGQDASTIAKLRAQHRSFEKAGLSVTRVRKRAYLYPAIDAMTDEIIEAYGQALDRLSRRAFPS
jgi:hypothetical protein